MSICNGLDDIIDSHLRVTHIGKSKPHYRHIQSALLMSGSQPAHFSAEQLLEEMHQCLETNWGQSPRLRNAEPSKQNWRWAKQTYIMHQSKSPEKILEKAIVNATPGDWVNQVPTASGLFEGKRDRHRNIDLVHRIHRGEYEFIELKVNSNTPLFAAMEVLIYAVLYVLSRQKYTTAQQKDIELLQAKIIHLYVLAPTSYYQRYDFRWMVSSLNTGLQRYLNTHLPSVHMDFHFMEFASNSAALTNPQNLVAHVLKMTPVY